MTKPTADLTPKARKTRSALIKAARTQIGAQGAAGVTVMDVCQTAGVGRTSFYNYFDDVDALVGTVATETAEAIKFRFDQFHKDEPRGISRLEKCLAMILSIAADDPETMLLLTSLAPEIVSIPNLLQREIGQELAGAEKQDALGLTDQHRKALSRFLTVSTLALGNEIAMRKLPEEEIGQYVSILLRCCQPPEDKSFSLEG